MGNIIYIYSPKTYLPYICHMCILKNCYTEQICGWNLNKSAPLPHKVILGMGKWMMQIKPNSQTFFWLPPSHSKWLFRELWKFHFFFNWPLEFPCPSIPLEIPCFPHPSPAWLGFCLRFAHYSWYVFILYWVAILRKWPQSCLLHLGQV